MCIICNGGTTEAAVEAAARFLDAWDRAHESMTIACQEMLAVSKAMPEEDDRKRYDALHKRMVRVMHDWNRLEQEREASEPPHADD